MPVTYGILYDKDRRVKVLTGGVPVVDSPLQSAYAKYLNLIGDRFTAVVNGDNYDISLTYADKIIPYEGGVAKGTIPGWLNFDGNHFDVSSLASSMYTVTSTGRVKVNAISEIRPLNIVNATNNEAVLVADNAGTDKIDLTFSNDEVNVYNNGILVTAAPRALNFPDGGATDDATNDRVNIPIGIPKTYRKRWGSIQWSDDGSAEGEGLFAGDITITVGGGNDIRPGKDADGLHRILETGSDDNDTIGYGTTTPITSLNLNPHLWGKIKLQTLQQCRVIVGFHSVDVPDNNNTFLDNQSGFMLTLQRDTVPDTNWMIRRNNGAVSTTSVSSGVAVAGGTAITFELVGDNANSRWGWSVNGSAFVYYTTSIPIAATDLRFSIRIEEISGTETLTNLYYLYMEQDN